VAVKPGYACAGDEFDAGGAEEVDLDLDRAEPPAWRQKGLERDTHRGVGQRAQQATVHDPVGVVERLLGGAGDHHFAIADLHHADFEHARHRRRRNPAAREPLDQLTPRHPRRGGRHRTRVVPGHGAGPERTRLIHRGHRASMFCSRTGR